MESYAFLVTLPSGSDMQRGRTTCSRKVDHTGGCMFNSMSRIRNCSGNCFAWQNNCVWSLDWNLFLRMSRPFMCVKLSSSICAQQIMEISSQMQPGARLCQSTKSWSCNKHHNVAPPADANARICANARESGFRHRFCCDACWALADTVGGISLHSSCRNGMSNVRPEISMKLRFTRVFRQSNDLIYWINGVDDPSVD
jgi:hypothetical protein